MWMHYHYTLKILGFCLLTMGIVNAPVCNKANIPNSEPDSLHTSIDLPQIIAKKKLVAITDNSTTSYFIYKGEPMGYEYELLELFAKSIDVELQIIVAKNMDDILEKLKKGEADIACANLTITEERMKKVAFSDPLILFKGSQTAGKQCRKKK
jgi:membrane-bound lytic murein transglycosylase F